MPANTKSGRREAQCANTVFMVRPVAFHANPLTLDSNAFMKEDLALSESEQQQAALREFEGLAAALRAAGVNVVIFEDTRAPGTPDSIFPNNWVSFHQDGTVVLYPMMAFNRRTERRIDIVEALSSEHQFKIEKLVDLSAHEGNGQFLEGTGSLVLDRRNRIAYACLSARTSIEVLGDFSQQLDYDVVSFDAVDKQGLAIYHTNVMMAQGDGFAIICQDAISDEAQRAAVLGKLTQAGQEVIPISYAQMEQFAGNMLELESRDGDKVLAMSQRAYNSLTGKQLALLQGYAKIVSAPINVIEDSAGGSVRCMLAEIFLPRGG